jgi:uncharacterized protein (DUF362 family)
MTGARKIRFWLAVFAACSLVAFAGAGNLASFARAKPDRRETGGIGEASAGMDDCAFVAFSSRDHEPAEAEIRAMVDETVRQALGEKGWRALCKPGDRVVVKVNLVGPHRGRKHEKGKAVITDPRVVKAVAEGIREAIGFEAPADLIVTDALFYTDKDPSRADMVTSFRHSGYDEDGDGYLDGPARARLVNCDAYGKDGRFSVKVREPTLGETEVLLPNFLRKKAEASDGGEYCDVLVNVPLFKSHGFAGITGALKLYYGFRTNEPIGKDRGRAQHSGYGWGTGNKELLLDYLCAQNRARPCDFVVLDALVGNRKGPLNVSESNFSAFTDYFPANAILASRDPVAIDTVEALLGGYDPASIGLLANAARDGLGENRPSHIRVAGDTSFGDHKRLIARANAPKRNPGAEANTWPFQKGWGGARLLADVDPPVVERFEPALAEGSVLRAKYEVSDLGASRSGISAIELRVGGSAVARVPNPARSGVIEVDLRGMKAVVGDGAGGPAVCELVVWDGALNGTRMEAAIR